VRLNSKSATCEKLLNLRLDLVASKRALTKAEAENERIAAEKRALEIEYDRMKADFGYLLSRQQPRSSSSNAKVR
jgi:hypothetical protein